MNVIVSAVKTVYTKKALMSYFSANFYNFGNNSNLLIYSFKLIFKGIGQYQGKDRKLRKYIFERQEY